MLEKLTYTFMLLGVALLFLLTGHPEGTWFTIIAGAFLLDIVALLTVAMIRIWRE